MNRIFLTLATLVVVSLTHMAPVQAQNGHPFETKFWQFLIGNNYKQWAPAPGQDGDFFSGQVPHGALLKLYINRSAAGNVAGLPIGSVVVLENYRSDKSLKSISVMYRTEGFNPKANDWYWIEYNPDGSVAEESLAVEDHLIASDEGSEISLVSNNVVVKMNGQSTTCIACHAEAGGADFAFFNDRSESNRADQKRESLSLK